VTLKDLNWKIRYRSSQDNLLKDFYVPALERAVLYQRSAGYFSTGTLVVAARGLIHLIKNGGKMQLVVSPNFSEEDITAIEKGYKNKEEVIEDTLHRDFQYSESEFVKKRLEIASWMIAHNMLDIKVACPTINKKVTRGIFHEKVGIFVDSCDNFVAFSGSSNESQGGYIYNFESFDVQCSWISGLSRELAVMKKAEFDDLWENRTNNLDVLTMPKAIKDKILKFTPPNEPEYDPEYDPGDGGEEKPIRRKIKIPEGMVLRGHQNMAWDNWKKNGCHGVFQHATGSGKTITALNIAIKLLNEKERLGVIVVCPQKHIVDQWAVEAGNFGFHPILGYEDSKKWYKNFNSAITDFNINASSSFMFITTNNSLCLKKTQELIEKIHGNLLIIGDEVHNLGARNISTYLPNNALFRMGLSATPDRWYDADGTKIIYDYFGPCIEPIYGIKEAILDGYLCKYKYYPYLTEFTLEEAEEYHELSQAIAKYSHVNENEFDSVGNAKLQGLIIKRGRLIATARNKLDVLRNLARQYKDTYFNLFYCGDGKIEDERQVDIVCEILGTEIGMKIDRFTASESRDIRQIILRRFKERELQGLVAIRCLDEGVDIPDVARAFILASSTNPRQFIQRRGRILRKSKNFPDKKAEIHDFIVVPPGLKGAKKQDAAIFNIERKLLRRELMRCEEFAETAENGPEARALLLKVKEAYNLMDV
jgi:superfamily II DNA or RNA helicase